MYKLLPHRFSLSLPLSSLQALQSAVSDDDSDALARVVVEAAAQVFPNVGDYE